MSSSPAKQAFSEETLPEVEHLGFAPAPSAAPPLDSVVPAPSMWTSGLTLQVPTASRLEIGLVVGFMALLHAGVAAATLRPEANVVAPKPLSRVQIAVERRQRVPPPIPPPPKIAKVEPKPRTAQPRREAPERLPEPAPIAPMVDTGSSAPASEDGTLYAGQGGLELAPPAPPPPPPAPKVEAPAPVVQAREGANYLKNPRPAYPSLARRQGWEGTTLLRIQVTAAGRAGAIRVARSSGRAALDDAATEAAKRWTFVPATQGGNPVSGWVTVPIVFRLQ